MTLLYYDPFFLKHRTGGHPERPERLTHVMRHLERTGLDRRCARPTWQGLPHERLARVHAGSYVAEVEAYARAGGGRIAEDTVCGPESYDVARFAGGAVCNAVERVVGGEDTQAVCLVRPPGHHALKDAAMGFCLFNNVALGARMALAELGLNRVLIVDWDVHHGNGTQDIFWNDPNVLYISTHQYPLFPGTGAPSETGGAAAPGLTINFPFPEKTCGDAFLRAFDEVICEAAEAFDPTWVLVSAGFDAHRDDPLAGLSLSAGDFALFAHRVAGLAPGPGRLAFFLEGGYDLAALRRSVAATLGAPTDRDVSTEAPTSGGPGMATVQAVKEIRREWTG